MTYDAAIVGTTRTRRSKTNVNITRIKWNRKATNLNLNLNKDPKFHKQRQKHYLILEDDHENTQNWKPALSFPFLSFPKIANPTQPGDCTSKWNRIHLRMILDFKPLCTLHGFAVLLLLLPTQRRYWRAESNAKYMVCYLMTLEVQMIDMSRNGGLASKILRTRGFEMEKDVWFWAMERGFAWIYRFGGVGGLLRALGFQHWSKRDVFNNPHLSLRRVDLQTLAATKKGQSTLGLHIILGTSTHTDITGSAFLTPNRFPRMIHWQQ